VQNVYASGWTATGARGVLAATMMNAYALADTILSDWLLSADGGEVHSVPLEQAGFGRGGGKGGLGLGDVGGEGEMVPNPDAHLTELPREVVEGLRDGEVVTYHGWKQVDAEEVRKGEEVGKERERMGWEEARAFLRGRG